MIILTLAIGMLLLNLAGYKTFFESSEVSTLRFKANLAKQEDKEKAKAQAVIVIMLFMLISNIFYIVSGNILGGLAMIFAAFMVLRTIYTTFKVIKEISEEKSTKSKIGRILLPMVTVYLVYFILTYIKM